MKHKIEYDFTTLATVEIDPAKAAPLIKEMVEFWAFWEDRLADNDGDYTKTWLKLLGSFIIRNNRPPKDDEGWYQLDGSLGIKLLSWERWEHDEDQIELG